MFQAPRGTTDVLPEEQPHWRFVREQIELWSARFGYERIDTPMFEDAALFVHGTGQSTDIVEKEMYTFTDRSGDLMALRPEGTPNTLRAYAQHGMASRSQPVRLYYWAPSFRYERPQAGRYRQFWQFGCEAIGEADAAIDAEQIELVAALLGALGLGDVILLLNSIGDDGCRPAYIALLRAYYEPLLDAACTDCRGRYERNALRLLDCKNERCQPLIAAAPHIADHLCEPCASHFAETRRFLDALGIAYTIEPRLVRGLDYYTRTVFEFVPPGGGQQSTIAAGGRYDGLMESLGGKPAPGTGFALGLERLILNLKERGVAPTDIPRPAVYVAYAAGEARPTVMRVAAELRRGGTGAIAGAGRSLKAQLRQANTLGVAYTVIVGQRELADGTVQVKHMAGGGERHVAQAGIAEALAALMAADAEAAASNRSDGSPGGAP